MTERSSSVYGIKPPSQITSPKLDKYSLNLSKINSLEAGSKGALSSSRGNLLKLSNIAVGSSEALPGINTARSDLSIKKASTEQNSSRTFHPNESILSSSQLGLSSNTSQNVQIVRFTKTSTTGFSKSKPQVSRYNEEPVVNFASPKNYILNKDQDIFGTKLFSGKLKEIMQTEQKKNSFSPSPKKCKLQEPVIMTERKASVGAFILKNAQNANNKNELYLNFSHLSYPAKQLINYGQRYLVDSTSTSTEHKSIYFPDKSKAKRSKPMMSSPVIIKPNGQNNMKKHQL